MKIPINTLQYRTVQQHSEFVEFFVDENEQLFVRSLGQRLLAIPRDRWRTKWALLGEGKIEFDTDVSGRSRTFVIRVFPFSEAEANGETFMHGMNGPLNLPTRHEFSDVAQRSADFVPE